MPKLVINPRLDNRIRLVDYKQYRNATPEQSRELTNWYEGGDLLVLANYRFVAGREVFNKLLFPNRKSAKKLLLHTDAASHGEPPRQQQWDVIRELLVGSAVSFKQFEDAVTAANQELLALSDLLFQHYRYDKRYCIYNISEMLAHNMHFDSPAHAQDFSQLRAFVNLDDFPRIWRVGQSLEEMVGECYWSAGLRETIGKHPREFSRATTLGAYGDRYESGAHAYPMHSIAFQPGEVWFLNPNMMAHEVVYGRRILDGVFLFGEEGLLNKDRFYPNIVNDLHTKHLGHARHWWEASGRSVMARSKDFLSKYFYRAT